MRKSFYLISVALCLLVLETEAQIFQNIDNGIVAEINNIDVEIRFYSHKIVRILKSSKGISYRKESLSVIKQPEKINLVISIVDDYIRLASEAIEVQLNTKTGKVTYFVPGEEIPMFPYWTFGYWQSRERYKSQDETVGVVKKYRESGVPFDGIIQDWQYWSTDNAYWNAMEFGNPEFPDPKAMIDKVHKLNAHIIISVWASFGPKTKQYADLAKEDMLLDFTTWPPKSGVRVYDAFNPEARDIYWRYLNNGVFSLGMDGWWLDSTEPDHFDIKEKDFDNKTYLGSFRKVRNAYP